jgi:hypothetical protein
MPRTFSFPAVTKKDLEEEPPIRLNQLLRLLAEQLSTVQGGNGPFVFKFGPITFSGTVTFDGRITLDALHQFADNNAAIANGLAKGTIYRTLDGSLKVVI